ncbi:MAG: histidine kinase dimerization/phospho-acceptor domain-containing protein [Candidatus Binatia bacterium]
MTSERKARPNEMLPVVNEAFPNHVVEHKKPQEQIEIERTRTKADELKDQSLSLLSQEIRTPLTAIMGYTGMMLDKLLGEINPEQEQALGKVLFHTNELLTMITGMLDAARLEALNEEVLKGRCPLEEALDEFERNIILKGLEKTGFNRSKTAALLGSTRRILGLRMKKLRISEDLPGAKKGKNQGHVFGSLKSNE